MSIILQEAKDVASGSVEVYIINECTTSEMGTMQRERDRSPFLLRPRHTNYSLPDGSEEYSDVIMHVWWSGIEETLH